VAVDGERRVDREDACVKAAPEAPALAISNSASVARKAVANVLLTPATRTQATALNPVNAARSGTRGAARRR